MNTKAIKQCIPKPVKKILYFPYSKFCKCRKWLKGEYSIIDARLHPDEAMYYCPCCNNKFRTFEAGCFANRPDIYNPQRYKGIKQEVICPICETIPRHRILAMWLRKHRDELRNKKILYFAQEPGIKMWLKRNGIEVTTADYYAPADLKLDLCNIEQPDSSWDWIVCNHVLEHVDDYKAALHELYRVLKPGGILIISFPVLESMPTLIEETEHAEENKKKRIELYGQFDHLRVFGADSKEILKKVGFIVSRIEGSKMSEKILPIVGPADYDVNYLFLCKKPNVVK